MFAIVGSYIKGWFMNKALIVVGLAAVVAIGVIGYQRLTIDTLTAKSELALEKAETAKRERDNLADTLKLSESDKAQMKAEQGHREAVLAARDLALSQSRAELASLSGKLRKLRETDEEFKQWSDDHVPDAVIRLLHDARGASGNQNSDGKGISSG